MKPPFPELTATVAVMPSERELREQLRLANRLVYGLRSMLIMESAAYGLHPDVQAMWDTLCSDLRKWDHQQS